MKSVLDLAADFQETLRQASTAKSGSCPGGTPLRGWPYWSEAVAVHPRQRQEAIDSAKSKGVPVEVDRIGRIKFTSQRHQRAYLRAYGMHNNDDNQ